MSSQRITRGSSDADKYGDLLELKLAEFGKKLATKDDIKEIKELFNELSERLHFQDSKISALEMEASNNVERIVKLETSVSELTTTVNQLLDKNAVLSSSIDFLKKQCDSQEQYSRRACLRIKGIEKVGVESTSDCVDKVVNLCNNLNCGITADDIDRAHRIGKDKKTMIVKFYSFAKRTKLYRSRNSASDGVKIHLDLTKSRLQLLDQAKELITDVCPVKYVFADINCNVVARMKSDAYRFFDNIDSFIKILNKE